MAATLLHRPPPPRWPGWPLELDRRARRDVATRCAGSGSSRTIVWYSPRSPPASSAGTTSPPPLPMASRAASAASSRRRPIHYASNHGALTHEKTISRPGEDGKCSRVSDPPARAAGTPRRRPLPLHSSIQFRRIVPTRSISPVAMTARRARRAAGASQRRTAPCSPAADDDVAQRQA